MRPPIAPDGRTAAIPAGMGARVRRLTTRLNQYIATGRRNPVWFAMFIFGRFTLARRLAWGIRSPSRRRSRTDHPTIFPAVDVEAAVRDLRVDGIHPGLMLPRTTLAEILRFAEARRCYANSDPNRAIRVNRGGDVHFDGPPPLIADYHGQVFDCPAIRQLATDGTLTRIATAYLRSEPQLTRCRLWWSFVAPDSPAELRNTFSQDAFHFDIDDWACLKYFFYLVDVDDGAGPHRVIRGSHRNRRLRHQFTIFKGQSLASLTKVYPARDFLTITGPAGFGFAEDPFAFHTGTVATVRPRLMLEVEYGVSQLPVAGRYGSPQG